LAVVRCGENSQHLSWSNTNRKFDIGVSYYGDEAKIDFPETDYMHSAKGGKWDGIYMFFQEFPHLLDQYEYFWLPDDDIAATAEDVNQLIAIAEHQKLAICQPALDNQSYYSHYITLVSPSFQLRHTNFVEIMAPLVSASLLKQTLHIMAETRSGFGLDFLWPRLAAEQSGTHKVVAIIDSVRVRHTRPVGGNLHSFMRKVGGNSALDELETILGQFDVRRGSVINGIAVPRIKILSGIQVSGQYCHGPWLALITATDLLFKHRNKVQRTYFFAIFRHALKSII